MIHHFDEYRYLNMLFQQRVEPARAAHSLFLPLNKPENGQILNDRISQKKDYQEIFNGLESAL